MSSIYTGSPSNVVSQSTSPQEMKGVWKRWATAAQQNSKLKLCEFLVAVTNAISGTPTLVQLVHPGRQSPVGCGDRRFFEKAIAPSAVPLVLGDGMLDRLLQKVLFGIPREMTVKEIREVVQQFASAAKLVYDSGFKGVQIHAAHGFLLTQFLSPKSNVRTDDYGGTPSKRARIVIDVIRAIRSVVPSSFCVGIKLNSADVGGAESLGESLEQVGLIAAEKIDFLEISGGTIEKLRMATGDNPVSQRTMRREAFFLDYARAVRAQYPDIVLMVTGGFRSRNGMQAALESNACDLIGLGRPAAVWPKLAKEVLLNKKVKDEDAKVDLRLVRGNWFVRNMAPRLVGVGVDVLYYARMIARLAEGKPTYPPPEGA